MYIGWTTCKFHLLTMNAAAAAGPGHQDASQRMACKCTLINTSPDGSILSSLVRQDCYVVCVDELNKQYIESTPAAAAAAAASTAVAATAATATTATTRTTAGGSANTILIGCVADLATGQLTFSINGKEATGASHRYVVETGSKLYPALFVEPTTKEVLQLELGRMGNCLPLSAGVFASLGKQVTPKCPPRLKLQYLKPIKWSRVPNASLKVHTLKMNNVLGWSLLSEENGISSIYTKVATICLTLK